MLAMTQGFKIRFGRILAPCGDLWELVRDVQAADRRAIYTYFGEFALYLSLGEVRWVIVPGCCGKIK